jgi:hypothetical protein
MPAENSTLINLKIGKVMLILYESKSLWTWKLVLLYLEDESYLVYLGVFYSCS